jgi:GntR family transcriptional regulator
MSAPSASEGATRLARDSHISLYRQIASRLETEIAEGRLKAQERLEPEQALMRRFAVSRITVRQAIDDLVQKGLVVRKQGKGTFVAGPAVRHDLQDLRGFLDVFFAQGRHPETRLLQFQGTQLPNDAAQALGLEAGDTAMHLQRLYILDGEPIAVADTWLTPEARSVSWAEAESHSSYSILQRLLGLRITRADMSISAGLAGKSFGRLLRLSTKAPVLILGRVSRDSGGIPREMTRFIVNSDAYEFTLAAEGPIPISSALKAAAE